MNILTIEIKAPELVGAIIAMTNALSGAPKQMVMDFSNVAPLTQPTLSAAPTVLAQPGPTPMNYATPIAVATLAPQQPTLAPVQAAPAPVATVPAVAQTYTMDQLAVAATQLVDAGRRLELVNLLGEFSVQALTALPPEHYGNFATRLRGMGARI